MLELQPDLDLTTEQATALLEDWLGEPVVCSDIRKLRGGMVNTVLLLEFDRPPYRAVAKLHGDGADHFAAEARALRYLRAETACPAPAVHLLDASERSVPYACLLLEHLPGVCLDGVELDPDDRADLDVQLAGVLAELHGHVGTHWGPPDTDPGSAGPATWAELIAGRLAAARAQPGVEERLASDVLARVDEAIARAPSLLEDAGPPTLVHGDVWGGNTMVEHRDGRWRLTGLLDPDLQFADVDYELAYLEVFDVQREAFFVAYRALRPIRPGYERRRLVYWLLTGLVHVGLFGDELFREFTARTADAIGRSAVR